MVVSWMSAQQAEALSTKALSASCRHGESDFHLAEGENEYKTGMRWKQFLFPLIKKVEQQ
jgi:hypothetical protein